MLISPLLDWNLEWVITIIKLFNLPRIVDFASSTVLKTKNQSLQKLSKHFDFRQKKSWEWEV